MNRFSVWFFILTLTFFALSCQKGERSTQQADTIDPKRLAISHDMPQLPKPYPYPEPLPDSVKQRQLSHSARTPEELIDIALEALAKRDTATLKNIMINEYEFRNWLWPEFPASLPVMNISPDFAWQNLLQNSEKGLRLALEKYGGKKFSYVSHRFLKGQDYYQTFIVHTQTRVVIADSLGRQREMKELGSFVEMNGRYKLMSYRDRD
ncbi:MAG: hypothetical protein RMI34_06800 [Chloroherpetonaceae bacterium]|nr:hypothetical protein [Chloroherpetonaceae bacterium]MCS7211567.1 hypothetical protein [Chloroherpetonaceae bacterium]MDW8019766.1 hypothetical protein [Chloroherpetonaceae bacterium]